MEFDWKTHDQISIVLPSLYNFLSTHKADCQTLATASKTSLDELAESVWESLLNLGMTALPELLHLRLMRKLRYEHEARCNRLESPLDCLICSESLYEWCMTEASCRDYHYCHVRCLIRRAFEQHRPACPGCNKHISWPFVVHVVDDVLGGDIFRALERDEERGGQIDDAMMYGDAVLMQLALIYRGVRRMIPDEDAPYFVEKPVGGKREVFCRNLREGMRGLANAVDQLHRLLPSQEDSESIE